VTNQAENKTLQKLANLQRQHKGLINLMPLQTGGLLLGMDILYVTFARAFYVM